MEYVRIFNSVMVVVVMVPILTTFFYRFKYIKVLKRLTQAQTDIENITLLKQQLEKRLEPIINVEVVARKIAEESKSLELEAKDKILDAIVQAEELVKQSQLEAERTLAYSNVQAKRIAGEAFDAKLNLKSD